jgi:TetR/AcrR family transcriptional regulator
LKQFAGARMQSVFPPFAAQIEAAVERGEIEPVRPEHVLVNMVGLCIFPFIARPMLEAVLGFDEEAFAAFVQERKQTVTAFLVQALGL